MSIASEITRIKGNIADAYEACAKKGGAMPPYDAEVEYIESTGTQYIDADVVCKYGTSFAAKLSPLSNYSSHEKCFFGAADNINGSPHYDLNAYGGKFTIWNGGAFNSTSTSIVSGNVYTISMSANTTNSTVTADINGTSQQFNLTDGAVSNNSVYIFALNANGSVSRFVSMRLYAFSVTQNGALVRDFIPVRVGDVGYLYDKVSGELFGNKGTGSFALGADVRLAQTSANLAGAIESIPQGGWVKPAGWVDLHKVLADYPAPEGYQYAVAMLLTDTFSDAIPNGNNSGAYRTSSNPDTVVTRNSGDRFLFDPTKHINHTHWFIQYFATSDARAELWGDDNYKRCNTILWVVGSEGANVRCSARFGINLQAIECDTLMIGGHYYDTCRSLQKVKAHKVKAEVSNMTSAFNSCALLREIECDEFDITSANVNNLGYMFYGSGLVKAPEMDTSNVLNFSLMLAGCGSLVSVPQYDYSNATEVVNNIWGMCALKELPDIMNMPNLTSNPNFLVNVNRCACKNVPTHLTINKSFSLFTGGTWWSDGFKRDTFAAFTDGEVTGGMVFNMNEVSGLTMTVNSAMKALFTTDEQEAIETTLAGKGWNISW